MSAAWSMSRSCRRGHSSTCSTAWGCRRAFATRRATGRSPKMRRPRSTEPARAAPRPLSPPLWRGPPLPPGHARGWRWEASDVSRERVAGGDLAAAESGKEPAAPLLGRAVIEALRDHIALRWLLQRVGAALEGGVQRLLQVAFLEPAAPLGVMRP